MRAILMGVGFILNWGAAAVCGQGTSATPRPTPPTRPTSPLDAVRFLVGSWRGEGSGQPGQGSGLTSFQFDLDGRVLVRRNHSEYPPAADKPAVVHEDLMVIYPAPDTARLEAVYFDNEGHVIEYAAEASPDGQRVVFISEAEPTRSTFRLTYTMVAEGVVDVAFEIAPPGAPGAFRPYLSGRTRRTAR